MIMPAAKDFPPAYLSGDLEYLLYFNLPLLDCLSRKSFVFFLQRKGQIQIRIAIA